MIIDFPTVRPYVAHVIGVTDGDTIRTDADMGLRNWEVGYKLRLARCNAWDYPKMIDGALRGNAEAAAAAKANLTDLLLGKMVYLHTVKDYKFGGEFVAEVILPGDAGDVNVIDKLIAEQWLAPWDGNGKGYEHVPPWPRTVA